MRGPWRILPTMHFPFLIGYFTRCNHRDLTIPFHSHCDSFIFASFLKIDMKTSLHLIRVPECYRRLSTQWTSTRKRHRSRGAWGWVIVAYNAVPVQTWADQLLSFYITFQKYVWKLHFSEIEPSLVSSPSRVLIHIIASYFFTKIKENSFPSSPYNVILL